MVYVLTVRVMVDAGRVEGSDNIVDPLHDNINKILEERRERLSHLLRILITVPYRVVHIAEELSSRGYAGCTRWSHNTRSFLM